MSRAKLATSARGALNARFVKAVTKTGQYADGGNLYLQVSKWGTKSWGFKYYRGKPHYFGLGSLVDVSLAEARKLAAEQRALRREGLDPLQERKKKTRSSKTFSEVTEALIAAKSGGWTKKHKSQFSNTLTTYAYPFLEETPIDTVDTNDVLNVLRPIWEAKNETANRVRGRIESVIDYANAAGLREGENPARWKGHLSNLLPKSSAVAPVKHLEALPYSEMPGFMKELRKRVGSSPLALELGILTCMRVGTVVGAKWEEIDLNGKVWTVPAERMKGHTKKFKVPL